MIQGATPKTVHRDLRSRSGASIGSSSIASIGKGGVLATKTKSRLGLFSGGLSTPQPSPRTLSDGENGRFSRVEKDDESHNMEGIYLFADENVMMLGDIEMPFLVGEKLGSGASASVHRVDFLIPRFTTLALTADGRLPDLDDEGGIILNVLPEYDENPFSDTTAIEYIKSGLVYALKVVQLSSDASSKAAERRAILEYEIFLLEVLRSSPQTVPHCVRIFGSQILENEVLILLELAQCDLGSWLFPDSGGAGLRIENPDPDRVRDHGERGLQDGDGASAKRLRPLSPWQILDIWTQLINALEAVHAADVIHFDIKPKNILVIKENHGDSGAPLLKLADFGLARQLQGSKSYISADGGWGTLKYMAPEVIFQPTETFKFRNVVDVWSIGIILHQMLHDGRTPHEQYLGNGRVRLAIGIVDQRALGACREADWIVSALPSADRPKGILLRDFFLATQGVCLTHDDSTRARASDLQRQLSALKDALEHLKSGSVHGEDGVSAVIDCRPELKTLFASTTRTVGDEGVVKGTRAEKSSPSAIQRKPPVGGGTGTAATLDQENQSSTVSDTVIAHPERSMSNQTGTVIAPDVQHDGVADRVSSLDSKSIKKKCDDEGANMVGATSNVVCDLTETDELQAKKVLVYFCGRNGNISCARCFTSSYVVRAQSRLRDV